MAKSGFVRDLGAAVPPRARVMLIIGLSFAAIMGYLVLRAAFTGATRRDGGVPGAAQVSLRPGSDKISRATPLEKNNVPKNSPMARELAKIRARQIKQAQSTGNSYFEPLHFDSEKNVVHKQVKKAKEAAKPPRARPKPAKAPKPAIRKPLRHKSKAPLVKRRKTVVYTLPPRLPIAQTMMMQEANRFIQQERQANQGIRQAVSKAVNGVIRSDDAPEPVYVSAQGGGSGDSGGSGSQGGNANSVSASNSPNAFYETFQTPETQNVAVSQKQIDQFRHPELNKLGLGSGGAASPQGSASSQSASARYPTDEVAQAHKGTIINTAQTFYAYLYNKADSDSPAPLFAEIIQQGPLKGATLVSTQGPKRVGDRLIIKFDKMALGDKTYSVDALAINPKNYSTRLADSVNYHTFARYFKLGLAAFATGYANALSGTTTTINTNGSQTQQVSPLPSASDQVKVALGTVGQKLLPSYERYFNTPPTVIVNGHRPIGIIFMSPVTIKN